MAAARPSSRTAPTAPPNAPICDWVFTVDIGEEDENGETERRIFLDPRKGQKGTAVEGKRGEDAVVAALKKVRAHRVGLEIGGKIFITRGPKVAPKRGDAQCVTYTARYEPPAGGVGTGTPVDEVPWLIGGARFDPNTREEKPVAGVRPYGDPTTVAPAGAAVGVGGGAAVVEDTEPPF
jgi:hypothetical protein